MHVLDQSISQDPGPCSQSLGYLGDRGLGTNQGPDECASIGYIFNKMKPKNKLSREEMLQKKRDAERARYQKIKNDPIKLAEQKEKEKLKYLKKKEKGTRKLISEMTPREQRKTRKNWRAYSATHYTRKISTQKAINDFIRENTPSISGDEIINDRPLQQIQQNETPRRIEARKRSLRQRRKRNLEIRKKDDKIAKLKAELDKYKKRIRRLKKSEAISPTSKMVKLAGNSKTRAEVAKKAVFGEIIEKQIAENYAKLKSHTEKRTAQQLLLGQVVKQNKLWKNQNRIITYKKVWQSARTKKLIKKSKNPLRNMVQTFLEDDKHSRLCAGKKEFVTKNKLKKQKRYRLDTLRNLHREYLKSGNVIISYSMFARLTPFWIVAPKVADRDTCMCTLHSNFQLIVTALNNAKILKCSNYQNLLLSLCCDRYNEKCLMRSCEVCCKKTVPYGEINDTKIIIYKQWVSSKESIFDPKTKKQRFVVKQSKRSFQISPRDLISKLENDLVKFFNHELNIVHQYNTMKTLKESLTEKDAIIHMDFSENYCTKYNEEVQSFHFGGSRTQISLHTVVVYVKNSVKSYCTISSNLSHNVSAIWAHLKPVLAEIPSTVENVHFLSDGPVTQYRNKQMFYILACKMPLLCPEILNWSWNYHEAGHGKGAPDGIGAVCKRTADSVVATGGDITNLKEFGDIIQERCPNITIFSVTDSNIEEMNKLISTNQPNLIPFNGTLKVHQVTGNTYAPQKLLAKSLSCFCQVDGCTHYKLGLVEYPATRRLSMANVYSDSESEIENTCSSATHSIWKPICREQILATSVTEQSVKQQDHSNVDDLTLNLENPEVLAEATVLDISVTEMLAQALNETVAGPSGVQNKNNSPSKPVTKATFQTEYFRKRTRKASIPTDAHCNISSDEGINDRKVGKKNSGEEQNKGNDKIKGKRMRNKKIIEHVKKENIVTNSNNTNDKLEEYFCIVCGSSYSKDTSGVDWIQCTSCGQWAQADCIKGDTTFFICQNCSSDNDCE